MAGEVTKICVPWNQPNWDELDWSRVKELQTRVTMEHRKREAAKAQQTRALACPNFVKHVRR